MKSLLSERTRFSIVLGALAAMLVALAVLQYRWSQEVSEAAGARMRASLQSSMMRFGEDFSRELGSLAVAVEPSITLSAPASENVQRIEAWRRGAAHPELLRNIFVLQKQSGKSHLVRLNFQSGKFDATEWPPSLARLQSLLAQQPFNLPPFVGRPIPPSNREIAGAPPMPKRQFRFPWLFDYQECVLLHLQVNNNPETEPSWVLVELDENVLAEQVFPHLAETNFAANGGLEYDVAVVDRDHGNRVVYTSNSQFDGRGSSDAIAGLLAFGHGDHPGPLGNQMETMVSAGPRLPHSPHGDGAPFARDAGPHEAGFAFGPARIERFRFGEPGLGWELAVKHRKGSLEAALTAMHRRQLALSFGVLGVLTVTLAIIIVAARRAQRLAAFQVNFVTGVSHELRTPLAVIGSAAENIADGIVEDKTRVRQYGTVIRDQSRHLTRLVEQILLFAATGKEGYRYNRARVAPADLVKAAVDNSSALIRSSGFVLEQVIEPDLPEVYADAGPVSHCLQNLISNAVKYSGESRWVRVSAKKKQRNDGQAEVQIAVEDKGIGIARSDLDLIFDPFYRSPAVTSAQIHGTGLGLALAKTIAQAMDGCLTVESELGNGSVFTLHLPAVNGNVKGQN